MSELGVASQSGGAHANALTKVFIFADRVPIYRSFRLLR
jgi:hypothetical protein